MRELFVIVAFATLIAALPVAAQTDPGVVPENVTPGRKNFQDVRPGKVGPGSEKNSQVSPTSPDIPAHAQPPPDINLPAGSQTKSGHDTQGRIETRPQPPPNNAR